MSARGLTRSQANSNENSSGFKTLDRSTFLGRGNGGEGEGSGRGAGSEGEKDQEGRGGWEEEARV